MRRPITLPVRGYILKTLLHKEVLRFRYNWGLLVMVFALLGLSALVSVSARMKMLPGQGGATIDECIVVYRRDAKDWVEHLKRHPPPKLDENTTLEYVEYPASDRVWKPRMLVIALATPAASGAPHKIIYEHLDAAPQGIVPFREWCSRETQTFVAGRPLVVEETEEKILGISRTDQVATVVTSLIVFSMYLLSFNLFITSTGEEREKRVLLALLLSPASATEIVLAKAIFYGSASLGVALAVAAMYQPRLLLQPMLYTTILAGSMAYVAMGTVILSLVRRQTTLATVSLLYLVLVAIVFMLASFLPLFDVLRYFFIEEYLNWQLQQIVQGQWWSARIGLNHGILLIGAGIWTVVAIRVFDKRSKVIGRAR